MKLNCMIDLETMGKRFDAPVVSIGAVLFDIDSGEFKDQFYRGIDIADAFRFGRPDGDTVRWWMKQGDAARADAVGGSATLVEALRDLAAFIPHGTPVWGNGPTFDITILEYAYARAFDKEAPWKFWDVRDCRTMRDLGEALGYRIPKLAGTAHNALDDAGHQAKWVSEIWRLATNKRAAPVNTAPMIAMPAIPDIDDI